MKYYRCACRTAASTSPVWDPLDTFAADALGFAVDRTVVRYIGTRREIRDALEFLYPHEATPATQTIQGDRVVEEEEVDRLKDLASDAPIIRLMQRLINEAVSLKASDIHLEPSQQALVVRMRLDGMLRVVETHPKDFGGSYYLARESDGRVGYRRAPPAARWPDPRGG